DPKITAPLLPTSITDPTRFVTTSRVAVTTGATTDLKRYLYAIDEIDGSTMVFDVTPSSTTRAPVVRPHPEWNPFQPPDRLKFVASAQDVLVVSRDVPQELAIGNGVAPPGTRCDPDPNQKCDPSTSTCNYGVLYRTSPDFTSGALPGKLRGTYGFILLT